MILFLNGHINKSILYQIHRKKKKREVVKEKLRYILAHILLEAAQRNILSISYTIGLGT